jgi:siroheme synthase (precorrin-2 oxidase/ferrochelatase)
MALQAMPRDVTEYPFIFFPVGLNLRGRKCVVIGLPDDREAIEKYEALHEVGADVTWIKDPESLVDSDVADAFFVIFTPQEEPGAKRLRALADEHKFLLCAIDQPKYGFVAMQATVKAGPVRVAISTGGIAPRVGKLMKFALERVLDATFVRYIDCHNVQKERNKARLTTSPERRAAMIAKSEGFEFDVTIRYPKWFRDELAGMRPTVLDVADE